MTRHTFFAGSATALQAQTLRRKVRIGVVGGRFGSTFQFHLDLAAEVAAVCDIAPDRLQRLTEVAEESWP